MIIIEHKQSEKPNYLVEAISMTVAITCMALLVFTDTFSASSHDTEQPNFQGFKMVNTSHSYAR